MVGFPNNKKKKQEESIDDYTERRKKSSQTPSVWPTPDINVVKKWYQYDMECLITLNNYIGIHCGYVKIPQNHPYAKMDYMDISGIKIHGGITFSKRDVDGTWIGFDTGHYTDFIPALMHVGEDWDVERMTAEVNHLAEQLFERQQNG